MEVTRIITLRVTEVNNVESESEMRSHEECTSIITKFFKNKTMADDVNVLSIQDFIMDERSDKHD